MLRPWKHNNDVKSTTRLLTLLLLTGRISASMMCLSCTDVIRPKYCEYVTRCGDHQVCYVEAYVTTTTRYNLGCRDSRMCVGSAHDTGQSVGHRDMTHGHVICSECCHGPLCNQAGCGASGFPTGFGPLCYACSQQHSPTDCSAVHLCNSNERCEGRLGGETVTLVGRRDTQSVFLSCNTCCNTSLCNTDCDLLTTTTVAPTLDTCINYIPECSGFTRDFCAHALYGVWAQTQCPLLCGFCRGTTIPMPMTSSICVDKVENCAELDNENKELCTSLIEWSTVNCYRYCNYPGCLT